MRRCALVLSLCLCACESKPEAPVKPPPKVETPAASADAAPAAVAAPDGGTAAATPPPVAAPLSIVIKEITSPSKLTSKQFGRVETWRPKKGIKFVLVSTEVTYQTCDKPPLVEKGHGFGPHGPQDLETAVCKQRGGCLVMYAPVKKRPKGEASENSIELSSARAHLLDASGQKLGAMGGVAAKQTCADCELITKQRCSLAQQATPYSFLFALPEADAGKMTRFELYGATAPVAGKIP